MGLRDIPALAEGAFERLKAYRWPGNVRELENAVERALILSRGEPVKFDDFTLQIGKGAGIEKYLPEEGSHGLNTAMRHHIQKVLKMTEGKVDGDKGAAKLLGINPSTLRHRMRRLGIPFGRQQNR